MIRATTFAGKSVAVFGLGGSGTVAVQSLLAGGATVAAWDDNAAGRATAAKAGLPIVDLTSADWSQFEILVLAPGVPLTHPEPHWTVSKAKAAGVEIVGDIEIFARERAANAPEAPFIAITGTNGKSTTTALVGHILRHAGYDVQMGGNIGVAILQLESPAAKRFHVVEMSSFQIDLTPTLNPTVGVLLNVTPDHLDRHGTIENYAAVKEHLINGATVATVGVDDAHCVDILKRRVEERGAAVAFSAKHKLAPGYSMLDTEIVCANREGLAVKLGNLAGISTLRGGHNAQNALAAVSAVREALSVLGLPTDLDWQGALSTFGGLAHRMEEVGNLGSILFINDSKATNADSTEKALLAFPRDCYWILGGKPKDGGIQTLAPYFSGVAKAYLIGEASNEFAASLDGKVVYERCGTLDMAVAAASRDASASTSAQPVVLLSPACASYDQFKNFEVRGDAFRALVAAIPGISMRGRA
ncbi:MAG TPA: UDP-N-acetylmuramoyl-L-alanine--D-glutamate ligase [Hyphomicrobium sp.]|nr:UDP-N-acetylmuramoyl-L-alanine--D-glutamate ligase [Hyphomicrobium sp.]